MQIFLKSIFYTNTAFSKKDKNVNYIFAFIKELWFKILLSEFPEKKQDKKGLKSKVYKSSL